STPAGPAGRGRGNEGRRAPPFNRRIPSPAGPAGKGRCPGRTSHQNWYSSPQVIPCAQKVVSLNWNNGRGTFGAPGGQTAGFTWHRIGTWRGLRLRSIWSPGRTTLLQNRKL